MPRSRSKDSPAPASRAATHGDAQRGGDRGADAEGVAAFVRTHRDLARDEAFEAFTALAHVRNALARSPALQAELAREFRDAWAREVERGVPPEPAVDAEDLEELNDLEDFDALDELTDLDALDGLDDLDDVHELDPADVDWDYPDGDAAPAEVPAREYLCPGCGAHAIRARVQDGVAGVQCPGCAWETTDLLSLVPVTRTGAAAYVAGEGARAFWIPFLYASALAGAFLALRWIRL